MKTPSILRQRQRLSDLNLDSLSDLKVIVPPSPRTPSQQQQQQERKYDILRERIIQNTDSFSPDGFRGESFYNNSPRHGKISERPTSASLLTSCSPFLRNARGVKGPTSRVIHNPVDWCDESFLIPHEAIRSDLITLKQHVDSFHLHSEETLKFKLVNFAIWYREYHYVNVHHHHDAEENLYFPWMSRRCKLPPRLAGDHKTLMGLMDEIDAFFDGDIESLSSKSVKLLQGKVNAYANAMEEHLMEEEKLLPPLLRSHFTVFEESIVIFLIFFGLRWDGTKKILPLILAAMRDWGGEEKVAEFRAQFPFFINWFIDWTWEPDYRNRQKALLDSLGVDVLDDPLVEMKKKKDKGWWRWFF